MRALKPIATLFFIFLLGCGPQQACTDLVHGSPEHMGGNMPLYLGSGDPYEPGALEVRTIDVRQCWLGPSKPLQIHTPVEARRYPVILLDHGFLLANSYYSEILRHLAGHGFVVVAPQMYPGPGLPFGTPSTVEEAAALVEVLDWLGGHLSAVTGVIAESRIIGLAGHSRGGCVIWSLLKQDPTRARAVAGIDPVDNGASPFAREPRVASEPFHFPFPSLVIGAAFSSRARGASGAACAPEGDNHVQFYAASASPAWHVVALEMGHLDVLDASRPGCGLICSVCVDGPNPAASRKLVAGLLTAFFRASLQGDGAAYAELSDEAAAPAPIMVEAR